MTTVLSKLRDISERTSVPHHHLTRVASASIVALFAAKLSYPYVRKFVFGPPRSRTTSSSYSEKNNGKTKTEAVKSRNCGTTNSPTNSIEQNNLRRPSANSDHQNHNGNGLKPENDQTLGGEDDDRSGGDEKADDVLLQIVHRYESKIDDTDCEAAKGKFTDRRAKRTPSERNLTFGPERSNLLFAKLEQLFIIVLYEIRHLTGFNVDFVIQMVKLVRIMIPKLASREVLLLVMHTVSLISRTFLSIYVANLDGQVVKYIVRRDLLQFVKLMCKWLLIALPATFLNSLIRYLECKLALAFRSRLVSYAYEQYFQHETYYTVSNLDDRLENVDHSLTDDLTTYAGHCAHLYSSVTKPLLDVSMILITLFTVSRQMGSYGMAGPLLGSSIVFGTHLILRKCSPQFGRLVSEEARHKGFLRFVHSRVITNAEEIAFYRGGEIEKSVLERAYHTLVRHMNVTFNQKLWYVMLEQLLMKYLWSATGMVLIAAPIMLTSKRHTVCKQTLSNSVAVVAVEEEGAIEEDKFETEGLSAILATDDVSERTQYMMTAKNILISGSDALERLLSSYKELIELVGYTNRVAKMFTVFEQVGRRRYKRNSTVKQTSSSSSLLQKNSPGSAKKKQSRAEQQEMLITYRDGVPVAKGVVIEDRSYIRLDRVPVITPNCDIVVPSLSFTMTTDMHLLITGPNGCGKSSLFRILAGLWPVFAGRLERPQTRHLFYIPQRPYMSLGTLREQLIYPDSVADMRAKGLTDEHLAQILDSVKLKEVIKREGGWSASADWRDILSGGEKQRLAIARLFYHRPKFALLDECTSAVSVDIEASMYERAKSLGIALMTITHRSSLWKFHTHLLQFDGEGGWHLEPLDATSRMTLKQQKDQLERELEEYPQKQTQLRQLCTLLGEDSSLLRQIGGDDEDEEDTNVANVDTTTSAATGNGVIAAAAAAAIDTSTDEQYHSLESLETCCNTATTATTTTASNGHVHFSDNITVNA